MLNKLGQVLHDQGRKQEWLAKQLRVTGATVNRWCKNISQPNIPWLYEIAAILGTDTNELIYQSKQVIIETKKTKTYHLSNLGVDLVILWKVSAGSFEELDNCLSITTKKGEKKNMNEIVFSSYLTTQHRQPVVEPLIAIKDSQDTELEINTQNAGDGKYVLIFIY